MGSSDGAPRSMATSIYYMLTYDQPQGNIHMNKSVVRSYPAAA